MSKGKKTKRSKVKHASIIPRFNSRIRQEYIDADYIDQLDDTVKNCEMPDGTPCTEKEWYSAFMKEWNNASIAKGSVKDETGESAKNNKFHRTPEEAKECTDRNNSRNRDMYSIAKAQNMMHRHDYEIIQDWIEEKQEIGYNYTEDMLVDILDSGENLGDTGSDTGENSD